MSEHFGFYPESVKLAKQAIRDLARVLLTGRPDAEFLRPILIRTLTVELNDFVKYHQGDCSEGFATPEARKQFIEAGLQQMQSWDAQPVKRD